MTAAAVISVVARLLVVGVGVMVVVSSIGASNRTRARTRARTSTRAGPVMIQMHDFPGSIFRLRLRLYPTLHLTTIDNIER